MKKIFVIIIVVILGFAAYLGVHFALAYRTIVVDNEENTSWKSYLGTWLIKKEQQEKEENRLDILILGIRGENDAESAGGLLTDTIIVVSVDKETGLAAMVSIPRDLYVNGAKLNEVYERGLANGGGLAAASKTISQLTGVYIDNAVVFDFKAFSQTVDTLGGIDVYLANPFTEKTQWGYEFSLPAGNNHLNGEQALYYVRSRFSSSDFDRARRQQEVMLAIKKKATELGFIANPGKITSLLDTLKGNVRTNVQLWEIKDLLAVGQKLSAEGGSAFGGKTSVLSTDNLLYQTYTDRGEYILLPKGDDFKIIREYFKTLLAE